MTAHYSANNYVSTFSQAALKNASQEGPGCVEQSRGKNSGFNVLTDANGKLAASVNKC